MEIQQNPFQPYIAIPLPIVPGNADFVKYQNLLDRIAKILDVSDIEKKYATYEFDRINALTKSAKVNKAEAKKKEEKGSEAKLTPKEIDAIHGVSPKREESIKRNAVLSLRCNIVRILTQKDFRDLSIQLADSYLLRRFCQLDDPNAKQSPSKSKLQRMAANTEASVIVDLVRKLIDVASQPNGGLCKDGGLKEAISLDTVLMDSTCVELNIHFPTDWVLLRDAIHSMLNTIKTIRKHGLLHRMPRPETLHNKANKLAMQMTQASRRGAADGRKVRKKTLRDLKKLTKVVQSHGERYRALLQSRRGETDLSEKQAARLMENLTHVLDQVPAAIQQAHERIIGERLVKNDKKLLSLHEPHAKVYKRGKAGADIEFGLQLQVCENMEGLIVDWTLVEGAPMNDSTYVKKYLEKMRDEAPNLMPKTLVTDRGYSSEKNEKLLEELGVKNMICPKSPVKMAEKSSSEEFMKCQKRRGQTEGRIGILKQGFIGSRVPTKGRDHQEKHIAWAMLTHNLWVLARLPNRFDEEEESGSGQLRA